ncbi:hypothetical protein PACTADRAFT_47456 [Pachysolen tannophilus NRRL Y-2460]|uniref:WW domain-containing protein n=1 Tax=Pachysolen tannophilus NRRL Y-2460 TaxID=669874 RepID=A0A1E4U0P2_PACTA|nr:hypothetical protein PACTADRAFT_47456 [Pachysolen tannophilus NRRL Y-2460]
MSGDWEAVVDDEGRTYYYNSQTQESTWDKPYELLTNLEKALLESPWKEFTSEDGEKYYYNEISQESRWEVPEEVVNKVNELEGNGGGSLTAGSEAGLAGLAGFAGSTAAVGLEGAAGFAGAKTAATAAASGSGSRSGFLAGEVAPLSNDNDVDVEELVSKYPNTSPIGNAKSKQIVTQKVLDSYKNSFIEMLQESNVDAQWSFNKVMQVFIRDPRYWAIPDPLTRKELFESYLMNQTELAFKKDMNSKEMFRKNFIKVLQNYDIKYYTRWKTCSKKIIDEPIYSVASEKLKIEIFNEYVKILQIEHEKEQLALKKQALEELQDYLKNSLKISINSNWDELIEKIKNDKRFKENSHFRVLNKLDVLTIYESIILELEEEFNTNLKKIRHKNYRNDRKARDSFKHKLLDLQIKVTPNTTWLEFQNKLHDTQEFSNLIGRSGSSPIDYFWDLLDESMQILRVKKDLIYQLLIDLNLKTQIIEPSFNFDDFKQLISDNSTKFNDINITTNDNEELLFVFEMLRKELKTQEMETSTSSGTAITRNATDHTSQTNTAATSTNTTIPPKPVTQNDHRKTTNNRSRSRSRSMSPASLQRKRLENYRTNRGEISSATTNTKQRTTDDISGSTSANTNTNGGDLDY